MPILDRFGQPFPRKFNPFVERGVGGTAIYSGYIQTIERSSKWKGQERWKTASEIVTNISIVAAGVHHFLNLIARPKWSIRPVSDSDPEAVKLAEFVEDVLNDMETRWSRIVRRLGNFRFYGYGIHEWTAKRRKDGRTGLLDVEPRPQHTIERWEVDDTGKVQGFWQRPPNKAGLIPIPRAKVLYLVEDMLTDSPEGLGIFRQLLEPYERLKRYLELESRTFERDLRGIPIGRAPITALNKMVADGTLSQEEATTLLNGLENFVKLQLKESNTGMILDSMPYESQAQDGLKVANIMQWGLELLQGTANGLSELSKAIDRLQREMARVIGTEHLMMGDQSGNRALSHDKSRNLYLITNAVLADIREAAKKDLIGPIWVLNGFPPEKMPEIESEDVAFKDVEQIAATLKDMAAAGAVLDPRDPAIGDVREVLGISRPMDVDESMLGLGDDDEVEEDTPPPKPNGAGKRRRLTIRP